MRKLLTLGIILATLALGAHMCTLSADKIGTITHTHDLRLMEIE